MTLGRTMSCPPSSFPSSPTSSSSLRQPQLPHHVMHHYLQASPYTRIAPPKPPCDNDDYNFAFSLIQQGSSVKTSLASTRKSLARFETGLQRLSDAALLLAFKAKVAAKASKELENRLWILRAEEYRRITRYMEASRDMIKDTLSSSSDTMGPEICKLVDQGDRGGVPLASIKPTSKALSAEMGFYSQKVDDYRRITSYMDQYYGINADALAALQLQVDILLAHIHARSDEVELGSDGSCDEPDTSSSDHIDVGEESPDTDGSEDDEADDGTLAGDLLTKL